jgi:hypothetical protein
MIFSGMTQSTLLLQAKQGNPHAIAALLNRSLQTRGITATAQLEGNCLTIELAAAHPIAQASAIAFIRQGLNRLQPRRIHSVFVSAQLHQADEFAWMETFELDGIVTPTEAFSAQMDPEPDPAPIPSAAIPAHLSRPPRSPLSTSPLSPPALRPPAISTKGIEALIIGAVAAIVLFSVGFLKVLFYGAVILVHEVGHAVTHWAFGRPAIPTVNLLFGGGITLTFGQVWLLNGLIYLGLGYFIYRLRRTLRLQGLAVVFTAIYTYCLLTPTNQMLSVAMGHGMELGAIAVCLYLSASGKLCRIPGDRAIYAMLGFFILFSSLEFCWKLLQDPDYREWYEGGIGGMIDNDLVILATQYFHVDLSRVVSVFLVGYLLAPAIGLSACFIQLPPKN